MTTEKLYPELEDDGLLDSKISKYRATEIRMKVDELKKDLTIIASFARSGSMHSM